tara:strand:+ start:113 stop:583 length:471 start_codon:yes stop_codon:yes gene_type:complete
MANTVRRTVLANTDRRLVVKQTEHCDGTTATNTAIIINLDDASNCVDTAGSALSADGFKSSGGKALAGVAVERIWYSHSGGDIVGAIKWDQSSGADMLIFGGSIVDVSNNYQDYTRGDWGGITKEGANATGDIVCDVSGMGDGEAYTFIIDMRKIF